MGKGSKRSKHKASAPIAGPVQPAAVNSIDVFAQKEVAFYAAATDAWTTTRMEFDKTLVTLSAGGLGLFLTLLTTIGVRSALEATFYVLGTVGFSVAIVFGLLVFQRNAAFLEQIVNETATEKGDPKLRFYDKTLKIAFGCGAIFALLAGGSAAIDRYRESIVPKHSNEPMNENKKTNRGEKTPPTTTDPLRKSLDGMQNVKPGRNSMDTGSVDGLQRLKPIATPSPGTTTTEPSQQVEPVRPKKK